MNKMNNVDFDIVYLGLFPVAHKSEGLNVLLCDTIKPLLEEGVRVHIHTTRRHLSAIRQAMDGNGVDLASVDINAYKVESLTLILLSILDKLAQRRIKNNKNHFLSSVRDNLSRILKATVFGVIDWQFDLTRWNLIYKLPALLVISFAAVIAVISLSCLIAIVSLVLYMLTKSIELVVVKILNQIKRRPKIRSLLSRLVRRLRENKAELYVYILSRLYAKEQVRFSNVINRNRRIKRLFFFSAFEGHAVSNFKGLKLAVLPDIVRFMFPLRFIEAHSANQLEEIRLTIQNADVLVCYSEYVRDQQMLRIFPKEASGKRIEIIPQGYFLLNDFNKPDYLDARVELNKHNSYIVNCYPNLLFQPPVVDFTQFDFILYPTIDRPHKNMLTLVRAFSKVLREKHRNIKLILTTPQPTRDLSEFIEDNRLQYDVIFMPSVPINVLDLMFKCASLMVHPSLAEGGDIFNFSRAASVGIPSLMADVPVVQEMFCRRGFERSSYEKWVFNPTDCDNLANLIDQVMQSPSQTISDQSKVASALSSYSFSDMANRYLNIYESM